MTEKSKQVDVALACRKADIANLQNNLSGEPEGIGIGLSAEELNTQNERNVYQGAKNLTASPTAVEKPESSEEQSLGKTAGDLLQFGMDEAKPANKCETPIRNFNSAGDVTATNVANNVNTGNGNIIQFMCDLSLSVLIVSAAVLLTGCYFSWANSTVPTVPNNVHSSTPEVNPTPKKSFRFDIPLPSPRYKGRKQTMEDIRALFAESPQQTTNCWDRVVAIVGLGGIGKTELAYKFAAEFNQTLPSVAWINAETETSALKSFLDLAKYLKLVPNDQKEADLQVVRQVYRHIDEQDYGNVLFIFDNVVRLNSDESEFGVYEYLPTIELPNKRYPNILITTQTHYWERSGIKIVQLDELSEEESLEFFHITFQIESCECDDLFKKFHEILDGYPLAMNLAASQIDYNPRKDKIQRLRQQISSYIEKYQKENSKILNEKINPAWPIMKYMKTLSTVWQLSLKRLEQEENGRDALELLQVMSFFRVPMYSIDPLLKTCVYNSDCSCHHDKKLLKKQLRVLERFYFVREHFDDDAVYVVDELEMLEMHRLVQLVLRQQMDSQALIRVLLYIARDQYKWKLRVSTIALDEVLNSTRLSPRELVYVGILACYGFPPASKIFDAMEMEPEMENVATIWRLYKMERGMTTLNASAIQVLRELVRLTKSEERLEDRFYIGLFTIKLLVDNLRLRDYKVPDDSIEVLRYFDLDSFQGIEELVASLILSMRAIETPSCTSNHPNDEWRIMCVQLLHLTAKLSQTLITADAPMATSQVDLIADTLLAVHAKLRCEDLGPYSKPSLNILLETIGSSADSPSRIVKLRTCFRVLGLGEELIHDLEYSDFDDLSHLKIILDVTDCMDTMYLKEEKLRTSFWDHGLGEELIHDLEFFGSDAQRLVEIILKVTDCMGGMNLKDERVQQVLSAFSQKITVIDEKMWVEERAAEKRTAFAMMVCFTWIRLLLIDDDPPSQNLLESLSRMKALDWIEETSQYIDLKPNFDIYRIILGIPVYPWKYFEQFIQKYSTSDVKQIQKLLNFIALMEAKQLIENSSSGYGVEWFWYIGKLWIYRNSNTKVTSPFMPTKVYEVNVHLPRTTEFPEI